MDMGCVPCFAADSWVEKGILMCATCVVSQLASKLKSLSLNMDGASEV